MTDEIQLISDGDGVAVIGDPALVERFLTTEQLPARELPIHRLRQVTVAGSALAQAGSQIAADSGRWVKLTEKSARLVHTSDMMKGSSGVYSRAIAVAKNGRTTDILEFSKGSAHLLTNPAILSGAAGLMAQMAMQEAMDEITEYLKVIDAKVDDVLRAQKDAVLADMIGVDLMIEEAMTIRAEVGRVSDVTWSKVQGTSMTLARTQAYALRQLDALAEKLEKKSDMSELRAAATQAGSTVQDWLAVLARCFQLQDAIAVLELDRVLDALPEELDQHRLGLRTARRNRLELITRSTEQLVDRIEGAAEHANTKVLLNPIDAPAIVRSSNAVAATVGDFATRLGIERSRESLDAKRWRVAAVEAKDKAIDTGTAVGVGVAAAASTVGRQFRRVDVDGDGMPDEARALTAAKRAGTAVAGVADGVGGRVAALLKNRKRDEGDR